MEEHGATIKHFAELTERVGSICWDSHVRNYKNSAKDQWKRDKEGQANREKLKEKWLRELLENQGEQAKRGKHITMGQWERGA